MPIRLLQHHTTHPNGGLRVRDLVPANDPDSTLVHDPEYAYARDDEEMPAAT
jgi:hypothetical protein